MAEPAQRQPARTDAPPVDPQAVDRAYRFYRAQRHAKVEHRRATRMAHVRFWAFSSWPVPSSPSPCGARSPGSSASRVHTPPVETPDLFDFDDPETEEAGPEEPSRTKRPPLTQLRPGAGIWSAGQRVAWVAG